jgi:hypothetical protein
MRLDVISGRMDGGAAAAVQDRSEGAGRIELY